MKISISKQRGRPIYVSTSTGTISLVPEVRVLELRLGARPRLNFRRVAPYAVYVIDEAGVRRVRIRDTGALIAGLVIASVLLGLLPLLLWGGRKRNDG